jgi:hypothetical protein
LKPTLKVQEELKGRKMVEVNEDRLRQANGGAMENDSKATPKEDTGSRGTSQVDKRLNAILEYFNSLYKDYPLIVFVTSTFGTTLVFILKDKFGEKFLNYIIFDVVAFLFIILLLFQFRSEKKWIAYPAGFLTLAFAGLLSFFLYMQYMQFYEPVVASESSNISFDGESSAKAYRKYSYTSDDDGSKDYEIDGIGTIMTKWSNLPWFKGYVGKTFKEKLKKDRDSTWYILNYSAY